MLPLPPNNPSDYPSPTPSNFPQQTPAYGPPPTPQSSSNRKLWIILGSVLGGGCLLTVCGIIAMIGMLTILGRRVETTFDQINSGLEQQESSLSASDLQFSTSQQSAPPGVYDPRVKLDVLQYVVEPGTATVQPKAGFEFLVIKYRIIAPDWPKFFAMQEIIENNSHIRDGQDHEYKCCATSFMKAKNYHHVTYDETGTEFRIAYEVPKDATELHLFQRDNSGQDVTKVQVR